MSDPLIARVDEAIAARSPLHALDAWRVFNAAADGIDGLVIEKLGPVLIAQLHEGRLKLPESATRELVAHAHERLGTRAVYAKQFVRDRAGIDDAADERHRDATPWIGEPVEPELAVSENDIRLIVRPYDGFSVGLFLEHRDTRARIRELAAGRRVLNTFAYTCGYSVAAAVGGAVGVDSVDVSKRYLEWGKANLTANAIDLEPHRFFCSDVFDFYARARRQGRMYDLIILDPPTFARLRRPKRTFVLAEQLNRLVEGAVDRLAPKGIILLSTNHREISHDRLAEALARAAARRPCTILDRPPLPLDFRGDPDYAKIVLAEIG